MKFNYLIISIVSVFLFACNENSNSKKQDGKGMSAVNKKELLMAGKKAIKSNCYSCHNPQAPEGARLAPKFSEIKKVYLSDTKDESKYVEAMMNWIKNPSQSTSKMPDMIKKYGMMPKMSFTPSDEKLIAEYLYNYDVKEEIIDDLTDGEYNYKKQGMKYALTTKKQLGKNLMKQLNKNGTIAALKFCSMKAMPIIDSMSRVQGVHISRVSDKPRNPNNQATAQEVNYINEYYKGNKAGEDLEARLVDENNQVVFYSPIMTNPMCMQCHGNSATVIKPDVQKQIKKLYPMDKATGYSPNQVRGLWKVIMNKG